MNLRQRFAEKLRDPELRRKVGYAMEVAVANRAARVAEVPEWEELREGAHAIGAYSISHLDELLAQFEQNLLALGAKVFWARDGASACSYVTKVAASMGVKRIVKGKTMTSEEIELNSALTAAGHEVIETDLGEYLVQLAGDKPSHLTAPAVHLSRQDCGRLICEQLGVPYTDDPAALTGLVREALRTEFLQSRLGISGANFAVAETGTIVICDNEGNQGLTTALPEVHIALVGIDKLIPRLCDLAPLLRLLARSCTGQTLTAYTTLITGPRRETDSDGPRELHVILLDNGRTSMLADPVARGGLTCIRCGACCNICPIYSKVGGHPYSWTYPGAVGSLWAPFVAGEEWAEELPYICSLCGACSEICPVKNELSHGLVALRARPAARRRSPLAERLLYHLLGRVMASPRLYHLSGRLMRWGWRWRGLAHLLAPLRGWLYSRELPHPPPRSFHEERQRVFNADERR